jgi:hypothetical protein
MDTQNVMNQIIKIANFRKQLSFFERIKISNGLTVYHENDREIRYNLRNRRWYIDKESGKVMTNTKNLYLFWLYNEKNPVISNKQTWKTLDGTTVELARNEEKDKRIYVSWYSWEYIWDVENDFLSTQKLTDGIYDAILNEEITIDEALEQMRKLNLEGDF